MIPSRVRFPHLAFKHMDKHSYYIIVQEARQRLKENGLICPEIKIEDIKVDSQTLEPYYALDLDSDEERLYHYSLRELDSVIDSMLGRKEKPMPKTFVVEFDENFTTEIPQIWYERSKPIAEQNLEKFNNKNEIFDDTFNNIEEPKEEKKEDKIKKKKKRSSKQDLFDTYSTYDFPETYS